MILNGAEILSNWEDGSIVIDPFRSEQVGPNSYDVRLADTMMIVCDNHPNGIDPERPQVCNNVPFSEAGTIILQPGELYLGSTIERVGSKQFVPMLEGRSSIGRMGVSVHITAGVGDIGFCSRWTLEITVVHPTILYAGMRIGQVMFHECSSDTIQYVGRYRFQDGPVPSRYFEGR